MREIIRNDSGLAQAQGAAPAESSKVREKREAVNNQIATLVRKSPPHEQLFTLLSGRSCMDSTTAALRSSPDIMKIAAGLRANARDTLLLDAWNRLVNLCLDRAGRTLAVLRAAISDFAANPETGPKSVKTPFGTITLSFSGAGAMREPLLQASLHLGSETLTLDLGGTAAEIVARLDTQFSGGAETLGLNRLGSMLSYAKRHDAIAPDSDPCLGRIGENNIVSLVLSWSCITNYSQAAYLAESNYIAHVASVLQAFDCYGASGATPECGQLRKNCGNAIFAYPVAKRMAVFDALVNAVSETCATCTNGLAPSLSGFGWDDIVSAISALDGFRICSTNVPYFNPLSCEEEHIDAIVCQQGERMRNFYLMSAKFLDGSTLANARDVVAEISKIESLCTGLAEIGNERDAHTQYIPCLLFATRPEVAPYKIDANYILGNGMLLWGTAVDVTNRLSRMSIW